MATGTFHFSRSLQKKLIYHVWAKQNHQTISNCPHDDRQTEVCFSFFLTSLPCTSTFPAGTGKDLWRYPVYPPSQRRTSHRIRSNSPGLAQKTSMQKKFTTSLPHLLQMVVFNHNFPFLFSVCKINVLKMKETDL